MNQPALARKIAQAEADWATKGFRGEIEEAERVVRSDAERPSPTRLWDEWRNAFNPDIDTLTDPVSNQSFAPTGFSPANPFDAEWPTFTLSADEIGELVAEAPAELKDILDLSGTEAVVERVSFRSVGLAHAWLRPEIFHARFWRLPEPEPPLSDGGSPPQGRCPAYATGVVFARRIQEVTRQSGGGVVRTAQDLARTTRAARSDSSTAADPPGIPGETASNGDTRHSAEGHCPATSVAPAVVTLRSVSPLDRLRRSLFKLRPSPARRVRT